MATTVKNLIAKVKLSSEHLKKVRWEDLPNSKKEGIYIVSMPNPLPNIPLDENQIKNDNFKIQGNKTNALIDIKNELTKFWLPDETILYIGRSKNLSKRIKDYYNTIKKNSKKHRGGYWLRYIKIPKDTSIYYIECNNSQAYESGLLYNFSLQISKENREKMFGTGVILPFANLEVKVSTELKRIWGK